MLKKGICLTLVLFAITSFAVISNAIAPVSPLSIVSLTNSKSIDSGQPLAITGTWSEGTSPYSVTWYTGPMGTTCLQESANILATYAGLTGTSNSIIVSPTTTNSYCLGVTDSESPVVTQLSLNYTFSNSIISGFSNPFGVAFAPSGTYSYVTNLGSDNVVVINTATNTVTASITAGFSSPSGVAFSPSGTYAYVTGSGSNNVVIVNTATNSVTASITSGLYGPFGVAFSPSGTYAYVTNGGSNNVVIINTATNTVTASITSGFSDPYDVAFSPSGTYAYAVNLDSNNVVIINTATNTVTASITSGFSDPQGVAFSPSGTYAYVVNDAANNVVIINTATNTVTASITSGFSYPIKVAFSPSAKYAYITNYLPNNVIVLKPGIGAETTNAFQSEITVNPALESTQILPQNPSIDSGQTINLTLVVPNTGTPPYSYQWYSGSSATCSSDSPITGYNSLSETLSPSSTTYYCVKITDSSASSPEIVYTGTDLVTVNPDISTPLTSPSNILIDSGQSATLTYSWTGGTPDYTASLYSSQTGVCSSNSNLLERQVNIPTNSASFSIFPSSNTYYCAYITDNTVFSYAVSSVTVSGSTGSRGVAISPSGTYAYLVNTYAQNVLIINTATNAVISSITSGLSDPQDAAFSPSGTYAYVTNTGSNNVLIINTGSNTVINSITSGFDSPKGVAFSPSGTYAYVTNYNSNNTVIINTATNTVISSITSGLGGSRGVAFSPSGTYAYITNDRGTSSTSNVVIVNTATNSVTGAISPILPDDSAKGVAFSPYGNFAYLSNCNTDCFSSGPDNVVIINTATNSIIGSAELAGFPEPTGISFSPSGAYAYVSHLDDGNMTIINTELEITNSITSEAVVNPALGVPALTESPSLPATMESGSTIRLTASVSGGTAPYTYNYLITNTITGTVIANMRLTNAESTNSFAWAIPSVDIGNTVQANVIVTDSATTPETANSIKSGTITIIQGVTAGQISPSNPVINQGSSVSLTANVSGGTSPYAYAWYVAAGTAAPACTASNQITGQNSNSITVSPLSTSTYAYRATDSATYNSIECSSGDIVTVHPITQVTNPYAGGSTGFFGNVPGATTATTSTSSTTTTLTTTAPITIPYATSSGVVQHICNDASGYIVNYPSLNTTFNIRSGIPSCFNVTASNASAKVLSLLNRSVIKAINYTFSNHNVSANVTIHYRCSTPASAITPFILRNGTWQEITPFTVNVAACTVTFAAPADPTIGLFNISNRTTSTTAASTSTINATTVLATIPAQVQQPNYAMIIAAVIIAMLIIAAIVYMMRKKS